MRILGFDTATPATTVAWLDSDAGRVLERRDDPPDGARPRHTTRLLALVEEVLTAAGAGWHEVERIAVGVGPGTFTGLRIGVATALGLAQARDIPLVGVSTLHALAAGAAGAAGDGAAGDELVVPVIDARRREVFAAGWPAGDAGRADAAPDPAPRALPPAELAQDIARRAGGARWLAVGDGAIKFRAALEPSGARIPEGDSERHRVSAIHHCRLALGLAPEPPDGIRPQYLRLPDAEINLNAGRQR